MPFTACHAAVAAPLARRGFVLSALVVGSMAPDFEFFLRLSLLSRWGHTPDGILLFSLPAGLAALWLFHVVLKAPLMALLPPALQTALAPAAAQFTFGPPRQFARVLLSLLVGSFTHALFDSITHENAPAVQLIPWLRAAVSVPFFPPQPVYHLLQYAFSIGLGFILLRQCILALRRLGVPLMATLFELLTGPAPRILIPLAIPALILGICYGATSVPLAANLHDLRLIGGRAFVATGSALLLELIGFAWVCALHRWNTGMMECCGSRICSKEEVSRDPRDIRSVPMFRKPSLPYSHCSIIPPFLFPKR
jgi:hypothetical protein